VGVPGSQLFRGMMRDCCYPFDMPKKRFHGFNPKVSVGIDGAMIWYKGVHAAIHHIMERHDIVYTAF
jgi:hypothetical protein